MSVHEPLGLVAAALHELDPSAGDDPLLGLGHRGVRQLGHLADRLGLLGRLMEEADEGARGSVELAATLRQAVDDVAAIRPRRRVETTVDVGPALWVRGDAGRLRAALLELLDNATRFARRSVGVSLREEGEHAVVEIRDDGPGPSASPETPAGGGLGIGLVLARAIWAGHGGTLELGVAEDGGTLAVLVLPLRHD